MTEAEHSPLKKRIVGAIVLVSLAVIFIPMFLSSDKPYDDGMPTFGSNIPAQPGELANLKAEKLKPAVPQPDVQPVARIPVDEHTTNGKQDSFLSKFDVSGNYHWAKTWGGIDYDPAQAVTVDSQDKIYVGGFFYFTVDFDPGPGVDNKSVFGQHDCYLSKFE